MGTLVAYQSMPREKRAPLGYLEYTCNSKLKYAEPRHRDSIGSASSATTDNSGDFGSQPSWKLAASQSSAQTTPDSISSYGRPALHNGAYLGITQEPVQSVDVPSWREAVEKENQIQSSIVPLSDRQNPRRTGPQGRGVDTRHISPPSTLVRQPERRHCFVSALVVFAAGLIAAIWPLSAPVLHDTTYAHNVLPLQDFITETLRRSKTSYSTLQVAMYYLVLLKEHLPKCDFTQEQSSIPADHRPMQCGRRMFLSALMLASKFLQDRNYSTRAWGKITGLPTSEINMNEIKFLEAVNWKLHVSKERFERWSHTVIALSAPPKPGMSLIPQPSLVETLGWNTVLDRLTPECLDDFSQFRDLSTLPSSLCDSTGSNGMLTPPSSPPDSTTSDQEESSNRPEVTYNPSNIETTTEANPLNLAPPPAPPQHNLPTPSTTPRLPQCSTSLSRPAGGVPRCRDSSSAMSMLKLAARPATRTLCPPPVQRGLQRTGQSRRPSISRRSSISSSSSNFSSPESVRSDLSGFPARSRSSSISSVASVTSSVLAPFQGSEVSETMTRDAQQTVYQQRYFKLPKVDCSSTLRPEEYSAADALLQFHESRQNRAEVTSASGSARTQSVEQSKNLPDQPSCSAVHSEKRKKKRTHSKTNISDLLNGPADDLQSLVRKDLMACSDGGPCRVMPEVDSKDCVGRQCKRNRSTRDQLTAVDHARILMNDTDKEIRSLSGNSLVSMVESGGAMARY